MRILPISYLLIGALAVLDIPKISAQNSISNQKNFWDGIWDFVSSFIPKTAENATANDSAESQTVSNLVGEAKHLIETGFMDDKVVSILLTALEIDSDDYEANYLAGTALLALRRSEKAQGFLYKAVTVSNWTQHNSVANLAEALRLTGDYDLASQVAQKGMSQLDNASTDPSGMLSFTLGSIFLAKNSYVIAADWFLSSAMKQKSNIDIWLKASTLQFPVDVQELTFAQNVLIQGIQENPLSSELHLYMGIALQKAGKVEEATTFYAEALRLDPANFDAAVNMATSLQTIGQLPGAQLYYEAAYKMRPDNAFLVSNFAGYLATIGKTYRALEMIEAAILVDPENPTLAASKSAVLASSASSAAFEQSVLSIQAVITEAVIVQDWDRVVSLCVDFGEPQDGAAWWYFSVGMALIFKGEFKTGYDLCKRAESTSPSSHLIQGCLAVSAQNLQSHEVSAYHFEKAYLGLTSNPTNILPFPSLGFYASVEEMEIGLLGALYGNQNFDRCLAWAAEFASLPSMSQGGVLILTLSQLSWTEAMIGKLPYAEKYIRDNGELLGLPKDKSLLAEIERLVSSKADVARQASKCLESSEDTITQKAKSFASNIVDYLVLNLIVT